MIVTDNKTILKEGSQPLPGNATSISEEDKIGKGLMIDEILINKGCLFAGWEVY